MSKKELRELTARLRLVKPKRRKGYKQEITEHQRLQLDAELRLFYRNQRLQEDDKWGQCY